MSTAASAARHYRGRRPLCDQYLPGHLVHWDQAKKAAERRYSWGRLERIDDDTITVGYLDHTGRYRTHDTAELDYYASVGDKISVCEPLGVLRYDIDRSRTLLVGVADASEPLVPCRYQPREEITPDTLAQRIKIQGDVGLPGSGLPGWSSLTPGS